jgi:signal transduction histidine kinase
MSLASVLSALAVDSPSLAALWQQIPAGICVYDTEGHPLSANESFTRIVGSAATGGQQEWPLTPMLARAGAGETVIGAEAEWATEAGPLRVHVSVIPVRAAGQITGMIALVTDASGEAGQRETMGIVGHDLRNPLAAIRMTAQLLAKPDEMAPERRHTLAKRILTSSTRMDSIVKGLLDYARAKAGALVRLERESVDLAALVTRVIEEHTANLTGRSVVLRVEGDVTGQWDPARLEQVVGHLVSNALRHGAEGESQVTLRGTADSVEIVVANQGPAISPELLPRVFDPFQIGPRPPGTPRRNIGLGLFVVKELTTAHGGAVSARSDDRGTEFRVELPRNPPVTTP